MHLQNISLVPIQKETVAVLGYGNQGRAQALNLRDSGVIVHVGGRSGPSAEQAQRDGFPVGSFAEALEKSTVAMFLLPDQVIPAVYQALAPQLQARRTTIGFAHGFCYHFGYIEKLAACDYFLVGPKGAGVLLRERFLKGSGLPGAFAVGSANPALRDICLGYAKAIGVATSYLVETSFQEEVECDLFGEQAVLCGGFMELMEASFQTLVKHGHSPEMAFFETCFEARMILELFLKFGPAGLRKQISPTAAYGGATRGKRVISPEIKRDLEKMFLEIRSGAFAKEWMSEVAEGMPQLRQAKEQAAESDLEKIYQKIKAQAGEL